MAKRVTVSIPDMLHEKMEKWRTSFNLSKMFQDAVAEAIQKKEDFQRRLKEDLDMGEIIERLRREKELSEGNYFDQGRQDGLLWARSASYSDILYALSWEDRENACQDRVLGHFFSQKAARSPRMQPSGDAVNDCLRVYIDGWKKGLDEFWLEVKDKL